MRGRPRVASQDPGALVDLNCDPTLGPERQAEVRQLLHECFGPAAEFLLRACGQAAAARRDLVAAQEQLTRILTGPRLRGIVTGTDNGHVRVLVGGGIERLLARPDATALGVGQTVLLDAEARAILAPGDALLGGHTFAFCEPLEDGYALVQSLREGGLADDARQLALLADAVDRTTLAPGDRVLGWSLDGGNLILITRRLGPLRPPVADEGGVGQSVAREDIVGLEDVLEAGELLFLSGSSPAFERLLTLASPALRGLVFQGVPGCGKTKVAQYFMGHVRARGGRALYRTASDYLSKWVGEGSATLRRDFDLLDAAYRERGVRSLLVIDELEAIALDRAHPAALAGGHLDVLDTLLARVTRSDTRVIGISNVAHRILETALTRGGRLRIVPFPATLTPEQVTTLVAQGLAGVELRADAGTTSDDDPRPFGAAVSDLIFAPSGPLAELLHVQLADGRVRGVGARDLATGAAIADGIVRPALARLVQRDLRAGRPAPSPLTLEELRAATIAYFTQRAATTTRDNVRSLLPDGIIPDGQAVVKIEHGPHNGRRI
jgi:hypothetical protein